MKVEVLHRPRVTLENMEPKNVGVFAHWLTMVDDSIPQPSNGLVHATGLYSSFLGRNRVTPIVKKAPDC